MRIAGFDVGFSVRPADGFAAGGDTIVVRACGERILLAVVDVLGHGPAAHAVAVTAEALLDETDAIEPESILKLLHDELSGSVGAAAGVAMLQPATGQARYAGVGNTVGRVFGRSERRLSSVDGVLGQRHPSARPVSFTLEPGEVLVMHTDGISSRFEAPGSFMHRTDDTTDIARDLIRRFGKSYDDAACLAARRIA